MNLITGKTVSVALIAALLVLATAENHAGEIELNLHRAMHAQVFEELKDNVQRLYESDWLTGPIDGYENVNGRVTQFGFPVANRQDGVTGPYPGQLGLFN